MTEITTPSPDGCDHTFKAIYDHEVEWESDDVRGILRLPPGVKVKVLNYDPVMKRIDMKQQFPPGYVEPRHTHTSWHSILVTKGRMCVAGKDLRPGDYVFGWDIPHGPYKYPRRLRGLHRLHGRRRSHLGEVRPAESFQQVVGGDGSRQEGRRRAHREAQGRRDLISIKRWIGCLSLE